MLVTVCALTLFVTVVSLLVPDLMLKVTDGVDVPLANTAYTEEIVIAEEV